MNSNSDLCFKELLAENSPPKISSENTKNACIIDELFEEIKEFIEPIQNENTQSESKIDWFMESDNKLTDLYDAESPVLQQVLPDPEQVVLSSRTEQVVLLDPEQAAPSETNNFLEQALPSKYLEPQVLNVDQQNHFSVDELFSLNNLITEDQLESLYKSSPSDEGVQKLLSSTSPFFVQSSNTEQLEAISSPLSDAGYESIHSPKSISSEDNHDILDLFPVLF